MTPIEQARAALIEAVDAADMLPYSDVEPKLQARLLIAANDAIDSAARSLVQLLDATPAVPQ